MTASGKQDADRTEFRKIEDQASRKQARYEEIAAELRQAIFDGKYPVGSKLPKENELRERFSVSRQTVRAALQILRDENLVTTRKRAGTFVLPHQTHGSNFLHAMSINDLVSFSNRWHFTIDTVDERAIDEEIANWANLPKGQMWLGIEGVAQFDLHGLPECWTTYYLNPKFASVAQDLRDLHSPILPMIETTFGITVNEIEQEFSAMVVPEEIAERISVRLHEPAITVRRICRASDGEIALASIEVFPTSRFRYRFVIGRDMNQYSQKR